MTPLKPLPLACAVCTHGAYGVETLRAALHTLANCDRGRHLPDAAQAARDTLAKISPLDLQALLLLHGWERRLLDGESEVAWWGRAHKQIDVPFDARRNGARSVPWWTTVHGTIVELAGANIFSGSNTFNGAVTISDTATFTFDSAFDVADGAVSTIQTNLELVPGTDVQAYSAILAAIAALNPQSGYVMVGNGSTWVAQGGATARTSLGLGTGDNVAFTNVAASGALAVTGASTLNGKVTAVGATSDATGLQFGTAGALYGSGSGIVSDDPVTLNSTCSTARVCSMRWGAVVCRK